ncbi:hypothetical protein GCM10027596_06260 [Nocardioides korecus]
MSATLPLTARTTNRTTVRVPGPTAGRSHLRVAGAEAGPVTARIPGPVPAPVVRPRPEGERCHQSEAVDVAAVRAGRSWRDEAGATTAEYATVTGCGVGFAALLFKFLTSDMGQELLRLIFTAIKSLLPF